MLKYALIAMLVVMSSVSFADDSDGCGLGWQVTQKKSFSATTTRATTNATVPPTFGMTSGTIGCAQHGLVKADKKSLHFADANYENLLAEISQGQGEYLVGFAATMGCSSSDSFASALQANFASIVSGNGTPAELVNKVKTIIRSNSALAQSCNV